MQVSECGARISFLDGNAGVHMNSLIHIMIHGLPMGAETAAGVERDQMADRQKAEIDSSTPFASVRAAVSMFGDCIQTGHAHHPQPHSSSHQGYVGHQAPHAPSHNARYMLLLFGSPDSKFSV